MLDSNLKANILYSIIKTDFLGKYKEYDGILIFLCRIWDLKLMPSEDQRFDNAYDDILQHMVNNNDWSYEELFVKRLGILKSDDSYLIKFVDQVLSPTVRLDKNEILHYVEELRVMLNTGGMAFVLSGYFEELPVYQVKPVGTHEDLPMDIAENTIPIYFDIDRDKRANPHFLLVKNNWNDYGFVTTFGLRFINSTGYSSGVGDLKIMKRETKVTHQSLSHEFFKLDDQYCSLGLSSHFYTNLKYLIGNQIYSVLLALRDVANFPKIKDQFEDNPIYKTSLLRDNEAERVARTVKFELAGINPNEYYKFNYINKPPYSEQLINLNFDFEYNQIYEHRIYALIGKNGTGKTRLLSTLAKDLADKKSEVFKPGKPIYGKVFTVSYSFFDRFEIPSSDATFNYVYCGLKKTESTWKTEEELTEEFYAAANRIGGRKFNEKWIQILKKFLDPEIISGLRFNTVLRTVGDSFGNQLVFDRESFLNIKKHLSSGQSVILFIITEILSQIRYDSLILYDEPETHLHPNAISALINTLFELVDEFESFCIIATHSPIIIQEIPSRNIFVIEREGDSANVRSLERESLGENLTVITQDIFGNSEVPKHFVSSLEKLVQTGQSYDQILALIESDNLPVTSNIRLYLKSLIPQK